MVNTVTANPPSVAPGDSTILTAVVFNSGNGNGTVTVTFKKGSSVIGTTAAQVIAPNTTVNFYSTPVPILIADAGQVIFCAEANCAEC